MACRILRPIARGRPAKIRTAFVVRARDFRSAGEEQGEAHEAEVSTDQEPGAALESTIAPRAARGRRDEEDEGQDREQGWNGHRPGSALVGERPRRIGGGPSSNGSTSSGRKYPCSDFLEGVVNAEDRRRDTSQSAFGQREQHVSGDDEGRYGIELGTRRERPPC
jgi:hypothetical protein